MKKISLYAGLVLSLASCNFTFDVESPLTEPLLSFEYIAGLHDEQSTWYGQFMIEKLVPVGAEVSPKNDYEIKQLHFTADGRELSWEREMNEVTGEYFSTFRAEIPSEPGTKLEVSVEAEGVAAVRASTTVPASPLFTCTPVQKRVFGESGELTEYIFEVKVSDYKEDDHLAIMLSWFDGYWWINADISGLGDD
ncbi:MAG: hypothetical protein ACI4TL_02775, partial [Candidatus Cryptobacteroides sp.]